MTKPWEQAPSYYAGIGSRESPPDVCHMMTCIGYKLAKLGWVLRTGGADGADTAFYSGVVDAYDAEYTHGDVHLVDLILPWQGFNGHIIEAHYEVISLSASQAAREIAQGFHPNWANLRPRIKELIARNTHQVLGPGDCSYTRYWSRFVVCWTPDGAKSQTETNRKTGGTGQAIRIASAYNIPVYNLQKEADYTLWKSFLGDIV